MKTIVLKHKRSRNEFYLELRIVDDLVQGLLGTYLIVLKDEIINNINYPIDKINSLETIINDYKFPKECRIASFLSSSDLFKSIEFYD